MRSQTAIKKKITILVEKRWAQQKRPSFFILLHIPQRTFIYSIAIALYVIEPRQLPLYGSDANES